MRGIIDEGGMCDARCVFVVETGSLPDAADAHDPHLGLGAGPRRATERPLEGDVAPAAHDDARGIVTDRVHQHLVRHVVRQLFERIARRAVDQQEVAAAVERLTQDLR